MEKIKLIPDYLFSEINNMNKRLCKCGCGKTVKGHPNKKFFNTKHKDRYWNRVNPRGYGLIEHNIEDEFHPCDTYSLGQD